MAIVHTCLMCHAPIVVPAVGGDRARDCVATTQAMAVVARRLVETAPDVLVVVSPHTPRAQAAWGLRDGPRVAGDLAAFRAPGARIDLPAAEAARARLLHLAPAHGLALGTLRPHPLDHGAAVPLWFVQQAGWAGPTLVVALPWEEGNEGAFGELLAAASEGARWAVLASGDMSHRLIPGAPAGYDPRAADFDRAFVAHLRAGDVGAALTVDPALQALAAEDVVRSVAVAHAATGGRVDGLEVLAYEGPFGVGYCEATLFGSPP